ncbi:MAG: hypothetical protein AB8G22_04050 [Saprospiraceae bacterium]
MNFDEQTYQRIQRYLDAEMNAAEAAAFEDEVTANPELAREGRLSGAMEQLLAETAENELRKSLQQLKVQFANKNEEDDDDKGGGYWRFLLLLIPLFLIGIWQWVGSEDVDNQLVENGVGERSYENYKLESSDLLATEIAEADTSLNVNRNPSDSVATNQNIAVEPPTKATAPDDLAPPPTELKIKKPPQENLRIESIPPPVDTTIQRDTTKIYAGEEGFNMPNIEEFSSIETPVLTTILLDSLVQENANQTKIQLTNIVSPDINISTFFTRKPIDSVTFEFSGEILAAANFQPINLRYQVFNYDQAYNAGQAMFAGTLPLQSVDTQTYSFAIERKLVLGEEIPALIRPYYVVITATDDPELLWVEQFTVVEWNMLSPTTYLFDEGSVMITEATYSFSKTTLRIPATIRQQSADATIILPLTGKLFLENDTKDILIDLLRYEVYSFDQEGNEPLYSSPLALIPLGGEEHSFITRDQLKLSAGNYYVLIKDDMDFTYGLEKFRVVE